MYVQVEWKWNLHRLRCRLLPFTSYKTIFRNKKRSGTSLLASIFSMIFEEKYFWRYIPLTDQIYCLIAFTSWDVSEEVYLNFLFPRSWSHKFWNNTSFLIKPFYHKTKKVRTKILKFLEGKSPTLNQNNDILTCPSSWWSHWKSRIRWI